MSLTLAAFPWILMCRELEEFHRLDQRKLDQFLGHSFRQAAVRANVNLFLPSLTLVQHRKQAFLPS